MSLSRGGALARLAKARELVFQLSRPRPRMRQLLLPLSQHAFKLLKMGLAALFVGAEQSMLLLAHGGHGCQVLSLGVRALLARTGCRLGRGRLRRFQLCRQPVMTTRELCIVLLKLCERGLKLSELLVSPIDRRPCLLKLERGREKIGGSQGRLGRCAPDGGVRESEGLAERGKINKGQTEESVLWAKALPRL